MKIRVEAPYDSYTAAVTFQKKIFEKGVGNRFYFSRKTGYHLDTSAIIKQ